jgi:hypothetical protein
LYDQHRLKTTSRTDFPAKVLSLRAPALGIGPNAFPFAEWAAAFNRYDALTLCSSLRRLPKESLSE